MVTFRVHEDATARYVKLIFAIFNVFHNRQSIEIEGHFSTKFDNYLAVHEEHSHLPFRMDSFVHGNGFFIHQQQRLRKGIASNNVCQTTHTHNKDYVNSVLLTMYVKQYVETLYCT